MVRRILDHVDVGRALIALAISILLFAYVRSEANPPEIASFEVPVDLVDVPPGLLLPAGQPPSVRVRLSAPRDTLSGIRSTSLRAFIDLRRGYTGIEEYPVKVELPDPRVRLMDVVPSEIPVRLEEVIERKISVRVNRSGSVPFGYEAGPAEVDPPEVSVSGPTSLVQRIASASVDLRVEGATVNIDALYPLTLVDAQGQSLTTEGRSAHLTPETVRVRVPISQQLSYKTVPLRASITGSPDPAYSIEAITVEPSTVTVVGGPQALRTIDAVDTQPLDLADAATTSTRQVAIRVPEGVSVAGDPSARITVRIAPLVLLQPFSVPIAVEGLQPGLQMTTALPFAQVVVRGTSTGLRAVDPAQIHASVDLSGLGVGLHEVAVKTAAPDTLNVQSTTPSSVAVRIVGANDAAAAQPTQPAAPQAAN
jgi:YbbR domain-containing protein